MVGDGLASLALVDVRQLRQLVLPQQADARDVEEGEHVGFGAARRLIKGVDIVGAGAAGIDHAGDAAGDADPIRLIMVNRRVGIAVHVRIDPTGAQAAVARQIQLANGADVRRQPPHRGDFAVFHRQIDQRVVRQSGASDY